MKNKRFGLISLLFVAAMLVGVFGCARHGVFTGNEKTVQLGQPYRSAAMEYVVYQDVKTGNMILSIKDISTFNEPIYVTAVVYAAGKEENDQLETRNATFNQFGQVQRFILPMKMDSLPLAVNFQEKYDSPVIQNGDLSELTSNWAFKVVR